MVNGFRSVPSPNKRKHRRSHIVKLTHMLTHAQFSCARSTPPSIIENIDGGIAWLRDVERHAEQKENK